MQLYGVGGWASPDSFLLMFTALSKLHTVRGHHRRFLDTCPKCIENTKNAGGIIKACRRHTDGARLEPSGNPLTSIKFQNYKKNRERQFREANYKPTVRQGLDIRLLIKMLIGHVSTNSLCGFRDYALTIIGLAVFNRSFELQSMTIDCTPVLDLIGELAPGIVDYIGIQFNEKVGDERTTRILWSNRKLMFLCPVTVIQWWCAVMRGYGITTGPMFPNDKTLKALEKKRLNKSATVVENEMTFDYNKFLRKFVDDVERYKSSDDPASYGTQSIRRTAVIIALLGDAAEGDLMKAARMDAMDTMQRYKQDAATLLELYKSQGIDFTSMVDKWRSPYTETLRGRTPEVSWNGILDNFVAKYPSAGDPTKITDTAELFRQGKEDWN